MKASTGCGMVIGVIVAPFVVVILGVIALIVYSVVTTTPEEWDAISQGAAPREPLTDEERAALKANVELIMSSGVFTDLTTDSVRPVVRAPAGTIESIKEEISTIKARRDQDAITFQAYPLVSALLEIHAYCELDSSSRVVVISGAQQFDFRPLTLW